MRSHPPQARKVLQFQFSGLWGSGFRGLGAFLGRRAVCVGLGFIVGFRV